MEHGDIRRPLDDLSGEGELYPIRISDWRTDPGNHPNLTFWMLVPRVLCVGRLGFPATSQSLSFCPSFETKLKPS
jgi:hypothetical protein